MKNWKDMTDDEWDEAIIDMAFELDDLNSLSDETLRMMYVDMRGTEDDVIRTVKVLDVTTHLENQEKEYTDELAEKISKYLERKFDANLSIYDNIDNAYDTLK